MAQQKAAEPKQSTISGSVVKVDFGQTSNTGIIEKGTYQVKVVSATPKMSSSGNPMIVFAFEILDGEFRGRRLYLNNSLQPHALFGFRKTLEALGVKVPTSSMDIDTKKLVNAQMNVVVDHEEYQGTLRAKVVDQQPLHYDEGDGGEEPADEAPAKKTADASDPENDI